MDTYEKDNRQSDPQPEEQVQPEQNMVPEEPTREPSSDNGQEPTASAQPEDGFYHGVGAGVTESTCVPTEPVQQSDTAGTETPQQPEEQPMDQTKDQSKSQKWPPKKKGCGKTTKAVIACVVVLALVITGCGISVGIMSSYWKNQNALLMQRVEEQMAVLQQELKGYKNGDHSLVVPTVEGMTPSQIYQSNISSVVAIQCVTQMSNMGQVYETGSAGSGFVLTQDGYVVTNHHVVNGATTISVVFSDGTELDAKLIGSDANNDIALVKVEATGLRPVTVGSSDALRVGDQVVAIGNALGELSFSLTAGYVSGMDRDITTDGTVINMIQTDVAINSGNSGGPLFNARGEVVGITSAKYSGTTSSGASIEGISFAIPMDDVYGMLEDLRQYGYIKSAYLGVNVQNVSGADVEKYGVPLGVAVKSVVKGACADKAGIKKSDVITNIGGYDVENLNDLSYALRKLEPGQECTITVWRAYHGTVTLKIVLDEKTNNS